MQGQRAASWLSKLSIRWILPAAVVIPVFAVALILTLLAYRSGQHTASELAAQSVRQIHERIENHLNHLMNLPPAIDQLNALRLRDGRLALDEPSRNRLSVFQTLQIFPEVSSIVLGSDHGQVMWVIRYPGETTYEYAIKRSPDAPMQEYTMGADGRIGNTPLRSYRFDAVGRPWYRAAIEAEGPTWGNVYIWVRGGKGVTLGVSYVEPYRDTSGKILGVVNCELTLADISTFLKRLEIGKTGMAFIMERDGNLVATSVGLNCMKDGLARLPAAEASDPRIVAATRALVAEPGALGAIDAMQIKEVRINGRPTLMAVSPYHNRRNLDWLVVTLVPDSDFLADIQSARMRSLWIGAAAILLRLASGSLWPCGCSIPFSPSSLTPAAWVRAASRSTSTATTTAKSHSFLPPSTKWPTACRIACACVTHWIWQWRSSRVSCQVKRHGSMDSTSPPAPSTATKPGAIITIISVSKAWARIRS